MSDTPSFTALRTELQQLAAHHAHAPYSGRPTAVALVLTDGTWVPGVRIENASFPLTIPALLAARCTAVAAARTDIVAAVATHPFSAADAELMEDFTGPMHLTRSDTLVVTGADLPAVGARLDPFVTAPADEADAVACVRAIAQRAYVPESNFPVGALLETASGRWIAGCNVEHEDWPRTLCAERTAMATALTYGETVFKRLYLTCPLDTSCTPCGACRQVLVEFAPALDIISDRGADVTDHTTPADLLPGFFKGTAIPGRPATA